MRSPWWIKINVRTAALNKENITYEIKATVNKWYIRYGLFKYFCLFLASSFKAFYVTLIKI